MSSGPVFIDTIYDQFPRIARVGQAMLAGQQALYGDTYRGKIMGASDLHLRDWFVPVLYQEEHDPQLCTALLPHAVRQLHAQQRRYPRQSPRRVACNRRERDPVIMARSAWLALALPLTLQPALMLPGNLYYQRDGVLKRLEVGKRLDVVSQAHKHLQLFEFFAELQQHGSFVASRIGPYDELAGTSGPVPEIVSERVLVVARKGVHHLFQVQTEVMRALVVRW
jgi:hypothetical protein